MDALPNDWSDIQPDTIYQSNAGLLVSFTDEQIKLGDSEALIKEHLELCEYKICGYWDDRDVYYEEINLPRTLQADLASVYIGVANVDRFLQLKFCLKIADLSERSRKIGEVVLIYNENLDFVDENWLLDVNFLGWQQTST